MSRDDDPDAGCETREKPYYCVSNSQLKTWWACRRKWGWEKLEKLKVEAQEGSDRSTGLGSEVHDQLERYLRDNRPLDFRQKSKYAEGVYPAEIAATGIHLLPQPQSPGLHVEKYFKFQVPDAGDRPVFVRGYKDFFVDPAAPGESPLVSDHKTCGNWAYALTADDLQGDPQAIIYAWDELLKNPSAPGVQLQWTYYGTKRPYRAQAVRTYVTREHVTQLVEEVFVGARELTTTYRLKPTVLSLSFDSDECGKYRGCPYQSHCKLSPRERRPFRMSNAPATTSLIDRQLARQAALTGTPAPTPGMTPLEAKIAAKKAQKLAAAAAAPTSNEIGAAVHAELEKVTAPATIPAPAPEFVVGGDEIDEPEAKDFVELAAQVVNQLPIWADPTKPDPLTGRAAVSPLPESDQPINCREEFQPEPATANTPVEVVPELQAAVAPKTKGRPKGSKNTALPEGVDIQALNAFLVTATVYMTQKLAESGK